MFKATLDAVLPTLVAELAWGGFLTACAMAAAVLAVAAPFGRKATATDPTHRVWQPKSRTRAGAPTNPRR